VQYQSQTTLPRILLKELIASNKVFFQYSKPLARHYTPLHSYILNLITLHVDMILLNELSMQPKTTIPQVFQKMIKIFENLAKQYVFQSFEISGLLFNTFLKIK
jgi:hypothetical protein